MFFTGLGTAAPQWRYTQKDCLAAIEGSGQFGRLAQRSRLVLRKVLSGEHGIATRHCCEPDLKAMFDLTPDTLHGRFARHGPVLGAAAGERAMVDAGVA